MEQWHPLIKLLHWFMAVLLFAMLGFGFAMTRIADQAARSGDYSLTLLGLSIFDAYQLHKSIGVLLFVTVVLRLLMRCVTSSVLHPGLTPIEHTISRLVHAALYGLMCALPLSGWMLASSSPLKLPTLIFGVFHLPHPIGPNEQAEQVWAWLHFLGGLALVALAALHMCAALKHHFWDQDGVLTSMLPRRTRPNQRNDE